MGRSDHRTQTYFLFGLNRLRNITILFPTLKRCIEKGKKLKHFELLKFKLHNIFVIMSSFVQ